MSIMDIATLLADIRKVAALATAIFGAVALVIASIRIFWPASHTTSTKLLGSLMVLALSFAANDAAVYGLAIFIVATLVTDLDFLEKLAALFWNRDKYWDYRLKQASRQELEEKARRDAVDALADESQPPARNEEFAIFPAPGAEGGPAPEAVQHLDVAAHDAGARA